MFSDINECDLKISNCPKSSICHNTIGSYVCSCNEGFIKKNNDCVFLMPKDFQTNQVSDHKKKLDCNQNKNKEQFMYCTFKNKCDKKSDCIYDQYSKSYKCRCWPGYIGDGFKCYSKILTYINRIQFDFNCFIFKGSSVYFFSNGKICRYIGKNQDEIICS